MKIFKNAGRGIVSVVIGLALVAGLSATLFGDVPARLNYQGRYLEDESPVTGNRYFKFSITDGDGGAEQWSSGDVEIHVNKGLFNYVLTPSGVDWRNITPYIEVRVGESSADTKLEPSDRINASIYSLYTSSAGYAYSLEGYTYDAFVSTAGGQMSGDLDMAGNKIAGLLAPVGDDEPATKGYVDALEGAHAIFVATRTLSASTETVQSGYYESTTLSAVDADLAAGNIVSGVTIFGFAGTVVGAVGDAVAADVFSGKTFSRTGESNITGTLTLAGNVSTFDGTANLIPDAYDGDGNGTNRWVMKETGDAAAGDILSPKKAWVDGIEVSGSMPTQTLSAANDTVSAGYYAATTLSAVDADLAAGNIKDGVTIFGVAGTLSGGSGGIARTGAHLLTGYTFVAGEDGHADMKKGTEWPSPRFTDNDDGTVTDNLTGLVWLKNANAYGTRSWANALSDCAALESGMHGLTDGSSAGDWRLPNIKELLSLIAWGYVGPALSNDAGTGKWTTGSDSSFTSVQSEYYWSSTTYAGFTDYAWNVSLGDGYVLTDDKTVTYYVWPVRGGQ